MTSLHWISCLMLACASVSALGAPPRVVAAAGRWTALRGPAHCEAAGLALLPATRTRAQARVGLSFDQRRRGQLAVRLSRPPRPGSSAMLTIGDTPFLLVVRGALAWSRGPAQEQAIITALRRDATMRIEAHGANGARFIDRFSLDGAPTAIDAAAACATTIPARR